MNNNLEIKLRVLKIVEGTSVDGPGLRTSIYFAGCRHRCEGCHNPQSWDSKGGVEMSIESILRVIEENDFNVTFSGGDPMEQCDKLIPLAKAIKDTLRKTIWCYTGYTWAEICQSSLFMQLMEYVDVLVDGRFELSKKDSSLLFCGSSNQHLIDTKTGDLISL